MALVGKQCNDLSEDVQVSSRPVRPLAKAHALKRPNISTVPSDTPFSRVKGTTQPVAAPPPFFQLNQRKKHLPNFVRW